MVFLAIAQHQFDTNVRRSRKSGGSEWNLTLTKMAKIRMEVRICEDTDRFAAIDMILPRRHFMLTGSKSEHNIPIDVHGLLASCYAYHV